MKQIKIFAIFALVMFFLSGCALNEYLNAEIPDDSSNIAENEKNADKEDQLDKLVKEIDEEVIININDSSIQPEVISPAKPAETKNTSIKKPVINDDGSFVKLAVKENEKVTLKPTSTDADKDVVTYTFTEPLNANGEWQTKYGDAGNYLVEVKASDGKETTVKKVLLTVERVNVKPVIEGVNDKIEISEGETLTLKPKVTDPNGDLVTVKISEPVGDDGLWNIDYQENGEYPIIITASDGELETKKEIKLTVKKKNVAPAIEAIKDITIKEGEIAGLKVKTSDVNGDKVKVTISEPIGEDGEWQTAYTDHGEYKITVSATDGALTTTKTIKLTVIDVNKAPEIIDIKLAK